MDKISKELRKIVLERIYQSKSSHIGGCFSCLEILISIYFKQKRNFTFIMSKGHAAMSLYAVLYKKKKISKKDLYTFGNDFTSLMSHVSSQVNGIEFSTGSLGHGLPYALGKSIAFKKNLNSNKVFVLLSDGELNEGSNWESFFYASHSRLDNLYIIIDNNNFQGLGLTNEIIDQSKFLNIFKQLDFKVFNIDGHNISKINTALNNKSKKTKIIFCNTIKGKGISFMENNNDWHYRSPNENEFKLALKELLNEK